MTEKRILEIIDHQEYSDYRKFLRDWLNSAYEMGDSPMSFEEYAKYTNKYSTLRAEICFEFGMKEWEEEIDAGVNEDDYHYFGECQVCGDDAGVWFGGMQLCTDCYTEIIS